MLEERDIQILSRLLDEKLDTKLDEKLDAKLDEKLDAKFAAQKSEIRSEILTVIESEVTPNLRLLAEGHDAILEKLVPESRIEALEGEIIVLKAAFKHLSEKLQELEALKNC